MAFKMRGYTPYTKTIAQETKFTDKENGKKKKKPVDDDSEKMTPEQATAHRAKILEYNKNKSKMDPNDPEAKLLQDMLNLPKNK